MIRKLHIILHYDKKYLLFYRSETNEKTEDCYENAEGKPAQEHVDPTVALEFQRWDESKEHNQCSCMKGFSTTIRKFKRGTWYFEQIHFKRTVSWNILK